MPELVAGLIALMLFAALVAVETSNLLYAIVSVGSVGILLSIAFLLLGAPDIAIVQVVVEIIALVILIRATIRRDLRTTSGNRELVGMVATVAAIFVLTIFGVRMLEGFPEFGSPVMERVADAPSRTYLEEGLSRTGAPNIVTAVLLDFRAYDTLGEATVLFCAILGAVSILRLRARKSENEPEPEEGRP
jgi:multisubunit Na+/H+ antiporter MnhB subunit